MFAPGDGAAPPELAGRSTEQAVLLRCLADLADGCAPPHNIVLIGPRGNGKTVLLSWLKAACDESEYTVDVLTLTPHSGMDATASNQDIDLALISAGLDDPADRFAAREGLNRLSYVWCPPGQQPPVVWSAGIPSLTSYVLAQAPESATQPSRVAPRSEDLSRR